MSVLSASFASTASFAPLYVLTSATSSMLAPYVLTSQTSSMSVLSSSFASTASSADNFTVRGTLTAQTIVVQTITSSTDFVTGSTRFGSTLSNTHQFTGSVGMTGSLTTANDATINGLTVGLGAGSQTSNTVVGNGALAANTTGNFNVAIGTGAMAANVTGGQNVSVGRASMQAATPTLSVAIGTNAMLSAGSGTLTVAVGQDALRASSASSRTTAIGASSAYNTSGNFNTAIGNEALYSNTSGVNQVAVGMRSLYFATGGNNIGIGYNGGYDITTGIYNTIIGTGATGNGITTGNYNTIIGSQVTGLSSSLSNTIILADGQGNQRLYINSSGNVGIGTISPNARLDVSGSAIISGSLTVFTGSAVEFQVTNTGVNIGNAITDTHNVTGSLGISGSVTATSFTGSLSGSATSATSASFASTASFVNPLRQDVIVTGSLFVSSSNATQFLVGTGSLFVSSSGNIGIGTSSPSAKLELSVGNVEGIKVTTSNSGFIELGVASGVRYAFRNNYSTANMFEFMVGTGGAAPTTNVYTIFSATRNISINSNTDAGFKLDVGGISRFQNNMLVTGSVTATSFTGSLSGSATSATSASFASTASFVTTAQTASYVLNAVSASFASTASSVNTLNQNVIITGSLTVGATSVGANENTLILGPSPAGGAGEGGQLLLAASGGLYTSASMLDNWQNQTRLLRGTNAGSDAVIASFNMHNGQVVFSKYTGSGAFPGSATANLSVDSGGNIITTAIGSALTGGSTNYIARWASSTTLTTGSLFDSGSNVGVGTITPSYKLDVSGDIRATGAVYANANGTMYFRGGDDAELWDINVTNTVGVYGQQDSTVASIKLGSGGGTISGKSGNIGIGTINPTSASLQVNGNVFATSFTGSLLGTASFATTATSASFAATSSFAASGFTIGISQIQTATVASSIAGANNLFTTSTGSFAGAKYLYTATSGSNARMGEIFAIWNGGTAQFTDVSTLDIGSTTVVTASVTIVTAQAQLNFQTNTSGWTIKSQATFI